jgi:hypothetical protein
MTPALRAMLALGVAAGVAAAGLFMLGLGWVMGA